MEWGSVREHEWVRSDGWKHEQYHTKCNDEQSNAEPKDEAPICAVHGTLMTKRTGKYGTFWSCNQKKGDGSWCDYRPTGQ